jgi:hypothetical protein
MMCMVQDPLNSPQVLKRVQVGIEQKQQQEAAVTSALALRQQFSVNGEVLELVEVFKYLWRLLAQDDDDIQAIRTQLRKAHATWAQVGQVLRSKNISPHVITTFYKAVVQAILLYGSKLGSFPGQLWCILRDFTFVLPTGWQRCISQS